MLLSLGNTRGDGRGSSLGRGHRGPRQAVHDANDTTSFRAVPAERQIKAVIPSIRSRKPPFLTSRPCLTPAKPHPHILSLQRRPLAPCRTLCNTLARSYLATAILAGTIIWWIDWVQTQFRFRPGPNWSTAGGAGRASGGAARPIQGCRRSTMPHDLAWHSAALLKQRQRTATLLQRWQRLSARFECR